MEQDGEREQEEALIFSRGDSEAQKAICEALGLDPAKTHGVVIEMRADSVALMHVTHFLTETQAYGLSHVLQQFAYNVKEIPCGLDTAPRG
jgi:hypothetical protein